MDLITVIINKNSNVRKKIRERYRELYQGWKKENPNSRNYTLTKLNANIRNVLAVNGKSFNEQAFKQAKINRWQGGKVLPYAHWFFLVRFQADLFGTVYAIVDDACYEGDYHNDTMNTTPYGEGLVKNRNKNIIKEQIDNTMKTNKKVIRLTESDLHKLIEEAVKETLNEIGDTFRGQYMMGRAASRAKSRGDDNVATDTFLKARKQRGQCTSKMNAFDKEGAYRRGYNDESVPKDKSNIRRNYKTYQSWDNGD